MKYQVTETGIASANHSIEYYSFNTKKEAQKFVKDAIDTCVNNTPKYYNGKKELFFWSETEKEQFFGNNYDDSIAVSKKEVKEAYKECYKIDKNF